MFTQAPDVTIDASIGQVVVPGTPTATPTVTPTQTSIPTTSGSSTARPSIGPTPSPIPVPTQTPTRRYQIKPLSIYGYGPKNSKVTLSGLGVSEVTQSDQRGFFRFDRIYSYSFYYPELCLQSVDIDNNATQPSCIPGLPNNSTIPLEVGPVLLSPTISLTKSQLVKGEGVIVRGYTIPNSQTFIFLSNNPQVSLGFIKETLAYNLPIYDLKSNDDGKYELLVSGDETTNYKIFSSTKFGGENSAKSTTLNFSVVSGVRSFWQNLLEFVLTNKFGLLMISELLVIMFLGIALLKSNTKRNKKPNEKDYLDEVKLFR